MKLITWFLVKIIAYCIVLTKLPGIVLRMVLYELEGRAENRAMRPCIPDKPTPSPMPKSPNGRPVFPPMPPCKPPKPKYKPRNAEQNKLDLALYEITNFLPDGLRAIGQINFIDDEYVIKIMGKGDVIMDKIEGVDLASIVCAIDDFYNYKVGESPMWNYRNSKPVVKRVTELVTKWI